MHARKHPATVLASALALAGCAANPSLGPAASSGPADATVRSVPETAAPTSVAASAASSAASSATPPRTAAPALASGARAAAAALPPSALAVAMAPAPSASPQDPQARPESRAVIEPLDDRYHLVPAFDRYGRRRPWNPLTFTDGTGEYPILRSGSLFDVYNTSALKGDVPIIGENVFFFGQLLSANVYEVHDKTGRGAPSERDFKSTNFLTLELFHGDTVFRPPTWRVRSTIAQDFRIAEIVTDNDLDQDTAVQELFVEALLWETDPYFDNASLRVGRQAFTSDFRGFVFVDTNDGVVLFGTGEESRVDYQFAAFDLAAKDPISNLNEDPGTRNQQFAAANVFLEDSPFSGYKLEATLQWAHDTDARTVDAFYVGMLGDGRIGDLEVAHALFWMTGEDDANPIAGRSVSANAGLAALELAVPDDWQRFVGSFLYATGDSNPTDGTGTGFDGVFDNPAFAGGAFNFWHHQTINVGGTLISNGNSFYPNLRGKAVAAPNSVNPGLMLFHAGYEAKLSNYWALDVNALYLRFATTEVLEQVFGQTLGNEIGFDLSIAARYRPFGIDNVIIVPGVQALIPTGGFATIQGSETLLAAFVTATLVF